MASLAKTLEIRRRAEQSAGRLPPLMVAAERVASTVAQGVHGRRRVGQGDSFWQFRRFGSGDAVQRIDWRQSAKSDRLYVRETEWEAAQSVWLWRDGSGSMDYRSARGLPTKAERAELLLLATAALLVRGDERIALLDSGSRPASGRAALERITLSLAGPEDGAPGASLPPYMPLPRYAQLVLIGDFLSPPDETDAILRRYAAQGLKGYVLQILDPAEESLPFTGRTRFEGLEGEGNLLVRRVETARGIYRDRIAAHIDGLKASCRRAGWSFGGHRTDRPPESALLGVYMALSANLAR